MRVSLSCPWVEVREQRIAQTFSSRSLRGEFIQWSEASCSALTVIKTAHGAFECVYGTHARPRVFKTYLQIKLCNPLFQVDYSNGTGRSENNKSNIALIEWKFECKIVFEAPIVHSKVKPEIFAWRQGRLSLNAVSCKCSKHLPMRAHACSRHISRSNSLIRSSRWTIQMDLADLITKSQMLRAYRIKIYQQDSFRS